MNSLGNYLKPGITVGILVGGSAQLSQMMGYSSVVTAVASISLGLGYAIWSEREHLNDRLKDLIKVNRQMRQEKIDEVLFNALLNRDLKNLDWMEISSIPVNRIPLLPIPQIRQIEPKQISALNFQQLDALTPEQFSAFSPKQISALIDIQISTLKEELLIQLSKNQARAFSEEQIEVLTANQLQSLPYGIIEIFLENSLISDETRILLENVQSEKLEVNNWATYFSARIPD